MVHEDPELGAADLIPRSMPDAVPWISVAQMLERMHASVAVGASVVSPPELFIDAIMGYSQQGNPHGVAAELIAATDGARVLSLDVPSGLELKHGTIGRPAVCAEATLTPALPKVALGLETALPLVGELYLADISIPAAVYEGLGIPDRSPFSHGPSVNLARMSAPGRAGT